MHGMMPPEPSSEEAALLPAVGEARWASYSPAAETRAINVRRRQWSDAVPLPSALPAAAVAMLDLLAIAGTGLFLSALPELEGRPGQAVVALLALLGPGIAGMTGAYGLPALFSGHRAALTTLVALGAGLAGLVVVAQALGAGTAFPPSLALFWLALAAPPLLGGRLLASLALRAAAGRVRQRAVLVGDGPQAARFVAAMQARPDRSLTLLGLVDDRDHGAGRNGRGAAGLPLLGSLDTLCGMIRRGEVDQVILTVPWASEARLRRLLALLTDYPVDVRLAPDLAAYRHSRQTAPEAGGLRLLRLADRPMRGWAGFVKTVEDYVLALAALAIAAVPMALIALAIRLDSPGPVLFRQRRTGFNNRDFYVFKFRTMYHEHTDHDVQRQVMEGDPRVTPVGAILRRTSLDELPQIFNVLRGEMSFIGPRPHAPGTRAGGKLFEEVVDRYAARHRVKPGLTGLAQVRGWRGPTETEEKLIRRVESDLEYIENWSPWLDFVILVRTLLAVARMRNAC